MNAVSAALSVDRHAHVQVEARLLDAAKVRFGFASDNALAGWLGTDRTLINKIRSGRFGVGTAHRIKFLDGIGFVKNRNMETSLEPTLLALAVREWQQDRNLNGENKDVIQEGNPHAALLRICKDALDLKNDIAIADFLCVSRPSISMIRTGRSRMGVTPRLRILCAISDDVDFAKVDEALTSTEYLIELLERPQHRVVAMER